MAFLLRYIRLIVGALVLACMAIGAAPAAPSTSIRPPSRSTRSKLLSEHKRISGECTLPDRKACTLEQTPRARLALAGIKGRCAGSAAWPSSA